MTFTQNPSRVIETRDKANKETVIVFLNPTCGHCQDAYPKIVKAAGSQRTKAQNIATVYVNAKDDKNKSLLKKYDVNNTPTLIQDVGGNVSVPISLVKYGEIDNDVIKNVYRQ
ncbi:hypothetical protein KAR63_07965 [Weissella uvarum]|nr:hypothetical protein [Weissella uvarum]